MKKLSNTEAWKNIVAYKKKRCNWDNWNIFTNRFEQLGENSGSFKKINTSESFKSF